MPLENFPRSDAFQHLDNLCRAFHRNGLEQKMNMVPVRADLKKMNFVPLFHFQTNLYQSLIHRLVKDHLAIFCRTDKMVQQYRNIVRFVYIFALTHKQIYHLRCKQRGIKPSEIKNQSLMNEFNHFLGIDISKEFFDAMVIIDGDMAKPEHRRFNNDRKGIMALLKWLGRYGSNADNTLVCLEHTGMYGKPVIKYLLAFKFSLWVEMSFRIIRSTGIQRGKNDKSDAYRIACLSL